MIVFLGDPAGRPPTSKRRHVTANSIKQIKVASPDSPIFPAINSSQSTAECGSRQECSFAIDEKSEAEKELIKFQSSLNDRRKVFVHNRNRSIHANKQSTMFDSWSAADLHVSPSNNDAMAMQTLGKVWKSSAEEFLVSKASYDAEKLKNSYKSARGKSPMLMTELFHQHMHKNPRSAESLLFLKRPFSANSSKMPADLVALDLFLSGSDMIPDFKRVDFRSSDSNLLGIAPSAVVILDNEASNGTHSPGSVVGIRTGMGAGMNSILGTTSPAIGTECNSRVGTPSSTPIRRMDSFASVFSGDDDQVRRIQRPKSSTGIGQRENLLPSLLKSKSDLSGVRQTNLELLIDVQSNLNSKIALSQKGKFSPDKYSTDSQTGRNKNKRNTQENDDLFSESEDINQIPLHELKLDESHYFGESAKIAFFAKFRQLTVGLTSSTIVRSGTASIRPYTGKAA